MYGYCINSVYVLSKDVFFLKFDVKDSKKGKCTRRHYQLINMTYLKPKFAAFANV